MNDITDQLGEHHRDYLKIAWRFVRAFKTKTVPGTLRFIVYQDNLNEETQYYLIQMEKHIIELLKDRDNNVALYNLVQDYSNVYNRNTNFHPPISYFDNKKENGVVVEVAFYLQSIANNSEEGIKKTYKEHVTPKDDKIKSSPVRKKVTIDRSIKNSPIKKTPIRSKRPKFATKRIRKIKKKVI